MNWRDEAKKRHSQFVAFMAGDAEVPLTSIMMQEDLPRALKELDEKDAVNLALMKENTILTEQLSSKVGLVESLRKQKEELAMQKELLMELLRYREECDFDDEKEKQIEEILELE